VAVTRFWALDAAEKSKIISKIDETSPNDAAATAPSTLEVAKKNEHVFDFSAAIKAQNRVTPERFRPRRLHREPSQ
tara:strand:+ start:473 stop:700 length:228 start_codon:yes stop_codon:yes gene_type:complete